MADQSATGEGGRAGGRRGVTARSRPGRAAHLARYPFPLDDFQLRAIDALDAGESVLVAAPTGSGKTVVAEYGVAASVAGGQRAFYTAPIKALSNQKFHDLRLIHGPAAVGLLTGDNAINADAPIVVMTTEVLRNMIYAHSPALRRLGIVVLDEVHFLQDAYRGPVWEEVIIHLPPEVRLVCLSATVSNADELSEWISTVRGPTAAVIEERRPVRLENLYLIGDRTAERLHLLPTLVDGRPNAEASRLDSEAVHGWRSGRPRPRTRRRLYTPNRIDVVDLLEQQAMLPAIYFIFSRNGCDEAAHACVGSGLRLTTGPERDRIREIVDDHIEGLDDHDLAVLGYGRFLAGLEAGIAAHHAGMVPPFKEAVEQCFVEGLVKVVFATETLAVGINMPARTVVIEKLSKFTGDHHQFLTPGEYTQLTGRAGRRGIDTLGHAIVLWSPFVPFDQVAALAASRSFQLSSAFRPTYNMTANLVRSYSRSQAHHLLNLSFAQYQADRHVVRLEARLERRLAQLESYRTAAASPFGDIDEYRARQRAAAAAAVPDDVIELALIKLRPGDVLQVPGQPADGRVVVITTARRKGGLKLHALTTTRRSVALSARDFGEPPRAVGHIELPTPFAPNRQQFQRAVVRALVRADLEPASRPGRRRPPRGDGLDEHPVAADPNLHDRLKAAAAAERATREVDELRGRVQGRTHSVSRRFDRVLRILETWGYVDGWSLTAAGEALARTFHECDLLVVEALRQGHLDDLDAPTLAGLVSVFTYEHRSQEAAPAPWFPSHEARRRWAAIEAMARQLREAEEEAGLSPLRSPDATFVGVAYAWAAGESFATVVEDEDLSGGDFVRNVKQLIDLLRQLGEVAPAETTRATAREAAERLFRGVVAASSGIGTDEAEEASA
jgi:ATP-dependent RNA helicase HelY